MEDLLDMIVTMIVTALSGALLTYGTLALRALRAQMKARLTAGNIAIIDKTIQSGVDYAKAQGLDEQASGWLSTVLGYTQKQIPDTLAQNKVDADQLYRKIEGVKAAIALAKSSGLKL